MLSDKLADEGFADWLEEMQVLNDDFSIYEEEEEEEEHEQSDPKTPEKKASTHFKPKYSIRKSKRFLNNDGTRPSILNAKPLTSKLVKKDKPEDPTTNIEEGKKVVGFSENQSDLKSKETPSQLSKPDSQKIADKQSALPQKETTTPSNTQKRIPDQQQSPKSILKQKGSNSPSKETGKLPPSTALIKKDEQPEEEAEEEEYEEIEEVEEEMEEGEEEGEEEDDVDDEDEVKDDDSPMMVPANNKKAEEIKKTPPQKDPPLTDKSNQPKYEPKNPEKPLRIAEKIAEGIKNKTLLSKVDTSEATKPSNITTPSTTNTNPTSKLATARLTKKSASPKDDDSPANQFL